MSNESHPVNPGKILQISTGNWATKILLSAVHFDLFSLLAKNKSMSALEIKKSLDLNCIDRHVYDYLDALTGLGFLQREGVWEKAIYSNSADTDTFLDKSKASYIGGMLDMLNNRLYGFWGSLEEGLRTGKAQNEAKHGVNIFEEVYKTPEQLAEFTHAMSGVQMGNFIFFSQQFDFSPYKTLTDAGGSSGLLSVTVARHNAHMKCVSFDLPPVANIANKTIEAFGVKDRVTTASGDFFADSLPKADMVVMGNILHDWDEDQKQILVNKAFEALPKGGAFVAIENIIDEDRRNNVFGLMMSLNMLIETGTGFDYCFSDFEKWTKSAGFSKSRLMPLTGPASAAIAIK